jgi:putative addiction module component (TIGR02574 family)
MLNCLAESHVQACPKKRREYILSMTQAVAQILAEVEQLSPPERAELADRLLETLGNTIPPEIERKQLEEVRRRIAQVESGEVTRIPGEQGLEQVRRLVASARKAT